jgi:hypothetical protein
MPARTPMEDRVPADFAQTQLLENALQSCYAATQIVILEQIAGHRSGRFQTRGQRSQKRQSQNAALKMLGMKEVHCDESIARKVSMNEGASVGFDKAEIG